MLNVIVIHKEEQPKNVSIATYTFCRGNQSMMPFEDGVSIVSNLLDAP